jgi:hypothetical protein
LLKALASCYKACDVVEAADPVGIAGEGLDEIFQCIDHGVVGRGIIAGDAQELVAEVSNREELRCCKANLVRDTKIVENLHKHSCQVHT